MENITMTNTTQITLVRFALFGPAVLRTYEAALGELSPAGPDPATG